MAASQGNIRPARALTAKGHRTRGALLEASRQVLVQRGYFAASVAEITRQCGLSQGSFYQYFSSKEQVLLELTDQMVESFWRRARELRDQAPADDRLLSQALSLVLAHTKQNISFIRVLSDLELMDPVTIAYYDSLARFLRQVVRSLAAAGLIRPLDPNLIAYGLLGVALFQYFDWGERFAKYPEQELVRLIMDLMLQGLSGPKKWHGLSQPAPADRLAPDLPPDPGPAGNRQGEQTRVDIFHAAERIFGQLGFNRASIAEITRAAGVAQGTFYVHFQSKQDLLEGVIRFRSQELRRQLRAAISGCQDRRQAEAQGMIAFFRYIRRHRELYRIVAECESISPAVSNWYYARLAQGYAQALEQGIQKGEVRELPVSFLVRALMGFSHMIGMKWLIWNSSPHAEVPRQLVDDAIELVIYGLAVE